jgi:hypothetical protein
VGPGTWVEIAVLMRGGIPFGNFMDCDVCVGSWEKIQPADEKMYFLGLGITTASDFNTF